MSMGAKTCTLEILEDGLLVHEAEAVCDRLQKAGIGFKVEQVSAWEAGVVDSHRNNWSTALTQVMNYFNQGGTSVLMRVLVAPEEVTRAREVVNRPPEKLDRKKLVCWVLVLVIVGLLVYAFVEPHGRPDYASWLFYTGE